MNQTISVIIPVYNTTEFLDECINSVLTQTYHLLEILIINDGSDKRCQAMIERLAKQDRRMTCYHFAENRGVGAARNFGLERATGDYVYFLDSDDYLARDTLQLLIENIGNDDMLSGTINNVTKSQQFAQSTIEINRLIFREDKTQPFNNRSVLNRLISRQFIIRHKLKFAENVACYSDLAFIVPAMAHLKEAAVLEGCFYYRRVRNDPISNPSLIQQDQELRIKDFLTVFNTLKDTYNTPFEVTNYLDERFINFYQRTILSFLRDGSKIDKWFDPLSSAARKLASSRPAKERFIVRREIAHLINGRKNKFARLINWHHKLRVVRKALKSKQNFYIQLYRSVFLRLPLNNKTIVFESFFGKNYACNPRYIYEYMLANNMDYKYVWSFKEPGKKIPGNPKQVKRFSVAYYYYLATSKYWVSNSRLPKHLDKREGNIYLQTWHGTPLKKLVFDMNDIHSADPNYKKSVYQQSRRWDYLLSANPYSTEIFRRAFKYEKPVLEFGYPRNDILYIKNKEEMATAIKQKLGIPQDKKVILYAPTWRDNEFYERGKYKFSLRLDLRKMKEMLGEDHVILLRMHYFIADHIDTTGFHNFAYNVSDYDDVAELYLISDILITDYSSVFFDYANLRRPILFYTYDLDDYRDTLRGFYLDIEQEVPGPLLKTTEEIIEAVRRIEDVKANYQSKYDTFYNTFCCWDDGKAAENIVKRVFNE